MSDVLQDEYAIDEDGSTVIGASWVNLITGYVLPMPDEDDEQQAERPLED